MRTTTSLLRLTMTTSAAAILWAAGASAQEPSVRDDGISFARPTISTAAAERIVNTCIDWYRSNRENLQGRPAVWVIDANGNVMYMKRIDGATKIGVETGKMKADSALYLFRSSKDVGEFARAPGGAANPTGIVMLQQLDGYPAPGGLPIIVNGAVIGAVGVGGMVPNPAEDYWPDEVCAQAGIDAVFGE